MVARQHIDRTISQSAELQSYFVSEDDDKAAHRYHSHAALQSYFVSEDDDKAAHRYHSHAALQSYFVSEDGGIGRHECTKSAHRFLFCYVILFILLFNS